MQDLMSTVVLSMDVCALYPLITVKLAKDTIVRMVKASNLTWENIDIITLERFIL